MKLQSILWLTVFGGLLITSQSHAEITLLDQNQFKLSVSGVFETDLDVDSTRSFRETIGNRAVQRPGVAGDQGRTQMSIRNSRLAFNAVAPELDGWNSRGYFEFDFLGFDPEPATATVNTTNNEAGLYNSPTMRVRHAYFQTTKDDWQYTVGQTWHLLGWQPYYFMGSIQVAPLPGMLYGRVAQIRGMKTMEFGESKLQVAVSLARPPQVDSGMPDLQAGARLTFDQRQSAFTGGGAGTCKLMPMSVAVSGAVRQFVIPDADLNPSHSDRFNGYAVAVNAFIPILSSKESVSNTLSLAGEFTTGQGDGDQFVNWTGGDSNPLASAGGNSQAAARGVTMDAGQGDFDANGTFHLIKIQTANLHLQYHLPNDIAGFVNAGVAQLMSSNIDSLTNGGKTSGGGWGYDRQRVLFANYNHDLSTHLRAGLEYAYVDTRYSDGLGAHDNRFEATGWYTF